MFFEHKAIFLTILIFTLFISFYYKYSHRSNFDKRLHLFLKQGEVLGKKYESALTGKEYYGFTGIPYAKAPIGELRFKAPEEHDGWSGVHDATKEGNICLQFNSFTRTLDGSEDCLFINVYTPQLKKFYGESKSLLPVMVFIHGGGFVMGSSDKNLHGPDFLINHGVILVTFNYRLHILGFLNLGIPDAPGNAGLKDQSFALKWVKENIKSFGGDPESVTLFGESAGAASVHYQMFSPLSKGLFQRSILQSGSAFCGWASTALTKEIMNILYNATGMDRKENITKLANTLKSVDAQTLIVKSLEVMHQMRKGIPAGLFPFIFVPSEEPNVEGAFLPGKIEILANNTEPMPVMAGLDESEFLIFSGFVNKEDTYAAVKYNLPSLLQNQKPDIKLTNETKEIAADKVKKFYYGDKAVNDKTFMETMNTTKTAYVYSFELKGDLRMSKILELEKRLNYPDKNVTVHGDEMGYLFHTSNTSKELLSVQENVDAINEMCTLWTNFAKTGDPNGNTSNRIWGASTIHKHSYLKINKNMFTINSRINEDRMEFWDKLKEEYNSK